VFYEYLCPDDLTFTKLLKMNLNNEIKNISVQDLSGIIKSNKGIHIIDVRETFEWDICRIEGTTNIPMSELIECIEKIPQQEKTVIMCHHGVRSLNVIHYLETKGFHRLINLEGGIDAWAIEIDKSMNRY
jgi:rhodanese-related sulfurtransferase